MAQFIGFPAYTSHRPEFSTYKPAEPYRRNPMKERIMSAKQVKTTILRYWLLLPVADRPSLGLLKRTIRLALRRSAKLGGK